MKNEIINTMNMYLEAVRNAKNEDDRINAMRSQAAYRSRMKCLNPELAVWISDIWTNNYKAKFEAI